MFPETLRSPVIHRDCESGSLKRANKFIRVRDDLGIAGILDEDQDLKIMATERGRDQEVGALRVEPRRVCRRLFGLSYATMACSSTWA
jgi:hypothetical protein